MREIVSMNNVHSETFEQLFSRLADTSVSPPKLAWMARKYIFTSREFCEAFNLRCKTQARPSKMKHFLQRGVIAVFCQGDPTHPTLYIWKGVPSCHSRKSDRINTKVLREEPSQRSRSKHIMPQEVRLKELPKEGRNDE